MKFNNRLACMNWLMYINEYSGGGKLLGTDYENVVQAAEMYDNGQPFLFFFAEIPLLGAPGVDLSVEYNLSDFLQGNTLADISVAKQGEFLVSYARLLQKHHPKLLEHCYTFLEADSSKGKVEKVAQFINLPGAAVKTCLSSVLELKGMRERQEAIARTLDALAPDLELWQIGFMESRQENPLRLDFHATESGLEGLIAGAKRLGLKDFVQAAEPLLQAIGAMELCDDYAFDVDILPDGALGDTIGVELKAKELYPVLQKKQLQSKEFAKLKQLFKEHGMADERLELLPKCIFGESLNHPAMQAFYVYSYLSHIKLVWKAGKPMAAKAYLEMRVVNRDFTVNDSFRRVVSCNMIISDISRGGRL